MWGCFLFNRPIKPTSKASAVNVLINSYGSLMNNDGLIIYTFMHTCEGAWSIVTESDAMKETDIV